jgi:hypothetical protein
LQMCCIESGNVRDRRVTLAPSEQATIKVDLIVT